MMILPILPTFAVHISDGVLEPAWQWAGFAVAGLLALAGAWRIRDEEIPRVALLTAAFFVASQIHVQVPGGPSTHLLLNGLLGVVLGPRALLAVPVGLFLQAVLFAHGGFSALGVNSVVMGLPALLAWLLFAGLHRLPWIRRPWFRATLVAGSVVAFGLSLVYAVTLLVTNNPRQLADADSTWADRITFHPALLAGAVILGCLAAWAERRLEHAPEFPLGLVVGEFAVLATILLHALVLVLGGGKDWSGVALLTFIIHLPLAVLEGAILGFTVGFLARVKPEMLGWTTPEKAECAANSLP
jgi:cobalt/nickel transport system permease protein